MILSSRKNPQIALYRELDRERKSRERERKFNIEGVRLCLEAARNGIKPASFFVTQTAQSKYAEAFEEISRICEPVIITDELGGYISDTKSPQGFFMTAFMPDGNGELFRPGNETLIILDGLQDAGNIGTIIRTCDAMGTGGIVLSPDCADIWSPKVVRGAMGSLFRLPVTVTELPCLIASLQAEGWSVYAALPDKNARSIDETRLSGRCAVVIGNEGSGVSQAVIAACGNSIYIPIENAESLNAAVAAAVFCNEIRKNRKG